jgi:hypothetical protein
MKSHRMKYQMFPLLFSLAALCGITLGAYSGGGSGVLGDEYILNSPADLVTLSRTPADWNRSFKLGQDIDMEGYVITPIGLLGPAQPSDTVNTPPGNTTKVINLPFTGTFCGNSHTIKNLTVEDKVECLEICLEQCTEVLDPACEGPNPPPDCPRCLKVYQIDSACQGPNPPLNCNDCVQDCNEIDCTKWNVTSMNLGLFGIVDNVESSITCLTLENPTLITDCAGNTGALIGYLVNGVVSCCAVEGGHVFGALRCDTSVGGLIGVVDSGIVTECSSTTWVIGMSHIGGLIGLNYGRVTNCYTAEPGRVTLRVCCCEDEVVNSWNAGGLVGTNGGLLDRNYASIGIDTPLPLDDPKSCINCTGCTGAFVGKWIEGKLPLYAGLSNFTDKVITLMLDIPGEKSPTIITVLPAIGCCDDGPNPQPVLEPNVQPVLEPSVTVPNNCELGRVESVSSEELMMRTTFMRDDNSDYLPDWDFETIWTIDEGNDSPRLTCHELSICNECQ